MTSEEAIKLLTNLIHKSTDGYEVQALNMAIKALEQDPSAGNEEIVGSMIPLITELVPEIKTVLNIVSGKLADISNEEWMDFIAKKSEKTSLHNFEQPTDGDLISRELAKRMVRKEFKNLSERVKINSLLNEVPSAEKSAEVGPMQVELEADGYADGELVYDFGKCPNCGWEFEEGDKDWEEPYCCHCGQKLKWFETEEEEFPESKKAKEKESIKKKFNIIKAESEEKPEKPWELKYVGYSSHDDESRYQCPVCKEGYGGWDFLNGSVRVMNGLFRCKCGQLLKKPE